MKNLYSRLEIDQDASAEQVRAALELKPELSDYAGILLQSDRRSVYDSAHSALKMIGALRIRLALDSSPGWFLKSFPDYAPAQNPARPAKSPAVQSEAEPPPADAPERRQPSSMAPAPPAHSRWWVDWLIPAGVLIIGVIAIAMLLW